MAQPFVLSQAQGSDCADEWLRLGVESHVAGNLPMAQQRYMQALRIDPRHALACQNLACVLAQQPGQLNEAMLAIERAAMFDGVHPLIQVNKALMLLEAERVDEAVVAARKAVEMAPDDLHAMLALATASTTAGMPEVAVPLYRKMLEIDPKHPVAGSNSCFILTLTNATPKELTAARKQWWEAHRYTGQVAPHTNDKSTDRPLRVGYVGGDFKSHSAAFIFARVLLHHTPAVEMYLYSTLPVDPAADGRTKQFQDACLMSKHGAMLPAKDTRWRDISTMSDEDADKLIRADKIDILVDLAGHTNGGRLTLFTRKPAPVQVTAWGFAHGTGVPEIDWWFADPVSVPESERADYVEKVYDLPSIVTMEAAEYGVKWESKPPYKRNGYMTVGSFARFEKMSDACLKTFAEILRRVPDAKMIFKDHSYRRPSSIRRIMDLMPDIAPERLLFNLATDHPTHLLSYHSADLCLDPYPHGGGCVALEQLFMSVPLVTRYGTQPSGRSASSVLTQLGRTDWIAKSDEEYVEIAVRLLENPPELAKARATLHDEFVNSLVIVKYVERVEEGYQFMWREWCQT